MKLKIAAMLIASVMMTANTSYGFELLDRMLGRAGCSSCEAPVTPSCGCGGGGLMDKVLNRSLCDAESCGCGAVAPACGYEPVEPDCGCEAAAPSCGCEVAPAVEATSCGCEVAAPSCGCSNRGKLLSRLSDGVGGIDCGCQAAPVEAVSCGCEAAPAVEVSCGCDAASATEARGLLCKKPGGLLARFGLNCGCGTSPAPAVEASPCGCDAAPVMEVSSCGCDAAPVMEVSSCGCDAAPVVEASACGCDAAPVWKPGSLLGNKSGGMFSGRSPSSFSATSPCGCDAAPVMATSPCGCDAAPVMEASSCGCDAAPVVEASACGCDAAPVWKPGSLLGNKSGGLFSGRSPSSFSATSPCGCDTAPVMAASSCGCDAAPAVASSCGCASGSSCGLGLRGSSSRPKLSLLDRLRGNRIPRDRDNKVIGVYNDGCNPPCPQAPVSDCGCGAIVESPCSTCGGGEVIYSDAMPVSGCASGMCGSTPAYSESIALPAAAATTAVLSGSSQVDPVEPMSDETEGVIVDDNGDVEVNVERRDITQPSISDEEDNPLVDPGAFIPRASQASGS